MAKRIKYSYKKLVAKCKEIIEKGWISLEKHHEGSDGALGNAFEELLGIKENNIKGPDYQAWEIKTKQKDTSSRVTLFNVALSNPKKANALIKDKYGTIDEESKLKILNTSIVVGRWTNTGVKQFTYQMEYTFDKLKLIVKNRATDKIQDDDFYWTWDKIKEYSLRKINNLCFLHGVIDRQGNKVKFDSVELFSNLKFDSLKQLILNQKIVFEFRIGVFKSGKNRGKPHDHGSAFRISPKYLPELYEIHRVFN